MRYRKDKQSKPIPVLLDQALRDRIEKVSGKMGEPKSTVMRIAMRIGLEGLEKAFETNPELATLARAEVSSPATKEGTAESFLEKVGEELSARAKGGGAHRKSRQ